MSKELYAALERFRKAHEFPAGKIVSDRSMRKRAQEMQYAAAQLLSVWEDLRDEALAPADDGDGTLGIK